MYWCHEKYSFIINNMKVQDVNRAFKAEVYLQRLQYRNSQNFGGVKTAVYM